MSIFAATVSLALAALNGAGPDVRAAGDCPTSATLSEQLRAMLPGDDATAFPPGAWLEVRDLPGPPAELELRLAVGSPPRELARRTLPASGSCAARAEAVAVVAASWAAAYRTTGPALPETPAAVPDEPPARAAEGERAERPAPVPEARPAPAPAPTATAVVVRAPAPPPARAAGVDWELGAGAGVVSAARGTAAPLVTVTLNLGRSGGRWPVHVALAAAGTRTLPVGQGEAAWRRATAAFGIGRRWGTSDAFTSLGADALVGASFLEGRGFAIDEAETSLELGGALAVRAGVRPAAAPLVLWVEAGIAGWAREQRVHVGGGAAWSDSLPRVDGSLTAGIAFGSGGR